MLYDLHGGVVSAEGMCMFIEVSCIIRGCYQDCQSRPTLV
jgi:hypothetical protein